MEKFANGQISSNSDVKVLARKHKFDEIMDSTSELDFLEFNDFNFDAEKFNSKVDEVNKKSDKINTFVDDFDRLMEYREDLTPENMDWFNRKDEKFSDDLNEAAQKLLEGADLFNDLARLEEYVDEFSPGMGSKSTELNFRPFFGPNIHKTIKIIRLLS